MVSPLAALDSQSSAWQQIVLVTKQIWSALLVSPRSGLHWVCRLKVYIFHVLRKYFHKKPSVSLHTFQYITFHRTHQFTTYNPKASRAVMVGEDRSSCWWGTCPGGCVSVSCSWRRAESVVCWHYHAPYRHWKVHSACAMANELSYRAHHAHPHGQHLRDGNLLMLLATRISIRAPFMWSPRLTWIWNVTNTSN